MEKNAKTCEFARELADSFNRKVSTYCRKKQKNIESVLRGKTIESELNQCLHCEYWIPKKKI